MKKWLWIGLFCFGAFDSCWASTGNPKKERPRRGGGGRPVLTLPNESPEDTIVIPIGPPNHSPKATQIQTQENPPNPGVPVTTAEIEEEKRIEAEKLAAEAKSTEECMAKLGQEVNAQGIKLDTMVVNVVKADEAVVAADNNLDDASRYLCTRKKRKLCLYSCCCITAGGGIAAALVLHFVTHSF